ncbi:MAG: LysM peptidoglycan-binding domain-containing protein, partial [Methylococcales bacterium]|nr:LysM peptidoglycan-binding domain-containing protein [Methylococcales bacterium]
MRNLSKTLAAISLLVPASANSLGIGDIKLHSSLNQKLNAEIALIVSAEDNLSNIDVRIASPEKFDEAGVPWSYFLSKIKVESIIRGNKSAIVKLSSQEALREPFLDFLLEVSWESGNLYREFTVLIDPPVAYTQPVIPIIQKVEPVAELKQDELIVEEKPQQVETVVELEKEIVEQEIEQKEIIAEPEKVEIIVEAEREEIVLESEQEEIVLEPEQEEIVLESEQEEIIVEEINAEKTRTAINSVITKESDTLWGIANKIGADDDVSIAQMMMGIFEANPQAFNENNVNALKVGQTLTIPEKNIILKLSQKAAISAFNKQTNVWKGRVAEKVKEKNPSLSSSEEFAPRLELLAPIDAEIDETAVISAKNDKSTDRAAELERLATLSEEGLALEAELEKVKQQLANMRQMLVLKDEQIAALQTQKASDASAEIERAEKLAKAEGLAKLEEKAEVEKKLEEKIKAEKLAKAKIEENLKAEELARKQEKAKAEVKPAVVTPPVAKVVPKDVKVVKPVVKSKVKPKLKTVVQPEPEQGLLTDMYHLIIAAVSACVFLILIVWWWWRRRNNNNSNNNETDAESMFANASEISLPDSPGTSTEELSVPSMDDSSSYDVGTVGESSFLSEFTPSDFDAFDTEQNEVDPISEADVYLAYGRYQQAEDLMRQAIESQPERDECKLKLLEIFYANENAKGFEEYATELANSGKQNDQGFWVKVVEMGSEISPESTLFKDQPGDKSSFDAEELELDNSSESADAVDTDTDTEEEASGELEFDLSVFDEEDGQQESSVAVAEVTEEVGDDNALDFDLSTFGEEDGLQESSVAVA